MKNKNTGAFSGGIGVSNYKNVNKLYEEEKFHARQGHGFAAERANHLYDKLTGKDAKIIGDDNVKNGADRIVNGQSIQSKYCKSGSSCVNECFDSKGNFRYMENGKPMKIEVPSDKYNDAVKAMEEKIRRGQVEGVSDPKEASKIIRKGHFTYEQARNIAKAGTVESLTYDSINGAIIGASAFGVSASIAFATSIWNGEKFEDALKIATYSGLKVGGIAFATSVMASQVSKAGLNSALVGSSEAIISMMGPKASSVLINAFRVGSKPIYGAAAMKSAAKLLRGNAITAGISFVLISTVDVADIFRGRISGAQLFKNLSTNAATIAGGTGGWMAGAAAGSAIFPGVGTVVGGILGSILGGTVANKTTDTVLGNFIEDDAEEMVRRVEREFSEMAIEYLLNKNEANKCIDILQKKLDGSKLKDIYESSNRSKYIRNILTPIVERVTKERRRVKLPTSKDMTSSLRMVLEEISDEVNRASLA